MIAPGVHVGPRLQADLDVRLGERSGRAATDGQLVIGSDARIRSGSVVYAPARIGDRLQTGHHVVIREENQIGDDVAVWSNSLIDYGCAIGDRVKVHTNCYVAQFTTIEDEVFLAPGVSIANDLYPGDPESAGLMLGPILRRGAQIGVNATILPYLTIGEDAIVAAGAVVTRDVRPGTTVAGCPAREIHHGGVDGGRRSRLHQRHAVRNGRRDEVGHV